MMLLQGGLNHTVPSVRAVISH